MTNQPPKPPGRKEIEDFEVRTHDLGQEALDHYDVAQEAEKPDVPKHIEDTIDLSFTEEHDNKAA